MSNVSLALPVGMEAFKELVRSVSPDLSICVRGRHAVGKSEGVYQAAADLRSELYKDPEFCASMVRSFHGQVKHAAGYKAAWTYEDGIPVMERRLSQMTEGDTIGLPFKTDDGRATMFKACDWLITSCDFPVVLFLDERNRALEGVKQSVFQLCDSKAFYGNRCHDETRVLIAENVGDEYQVQQCDPAEISRAATIVLEPSEKEWLEHAKKCDLDLSIIEFVRDNSNMLEHVGVHDANKKYPDRRSWFKLGKEAGALGLFDRPNEQLFRTLACSMLGVEVGTKFRAFCIERDRQVSAKDIVKNWEKAKKRLKGKGQVSNEMYIECVAKLNDHLDKNILTGPEQAEEVGKFMHDCPMEVTMTAWSAMQKHSENLFLVHPFVEDLMVKVARCQERGELKALTKEEVAERKNKEKKEKVVQKKEAAAEVTEENLNKEKKRGARKKQQE